MRIFRSLLQLFFRQFYTTLAWSYDIVARIVSVGQWNDWVRSILEPFPARPILEIAHGPGHLLLELNLRRGNAFGVDASRQMCRMASHRLKRNGHVSKVVQGRAQALPFPPETFATLLSTFPTEFILDPGSLTEAHRTLQLEGQYRIVPMAEIRGPSLLDRMAGWLFRVTWQYVELPTSWTQPISDAGFHVRREDVLLSRSRVIRIIATRVKQKEGQVV
ncbi:MAG: class I SAM-dependent methyltransferase [Anaerolineales bacterium]